MIQSQSEGSKMQGNWAVNSTPRAGQELLQPTGRVGQEAQRGESLLPLPFVLFMLSVGQAIPPTVRRATRTADSQVHILGSSGNTLTDTPREKWDLALPRQVKLMEQSELSQALRRQFRGKPHSTRMKNGKNGVQEMETLGTFNMAL